jgi:hypothetical protein
MLKKIVLGVALLAGLASVSTASIMLGVAGNATEISTSIDVLSLTLHSGELPERTPADLI